MEKLIESELIGVFIYNETLKKFEASNGKVYWTLDTKNGLVDEDDLLQRAENLSLVLEKFDQNARNNIAEKLIDYKNGFWPEYNAGDENLSWDAVEAGEYDVSKEEFAKVITLYDIEMKENEIYCEYHDGDLFGGHRIHASFDNNYKLLKASI